MAVAGHERNLGPFISAISLGLRTKDDVIFVQNLEEILNNLKIF